MKQQNIKNKFLSFFQQKESSIFLKNKQKSEKIFSFFNENNFPTKKTEDWKDTNVKNILDIDYQIDNNKNHVCLKELESYKIPDLKSNVLVFINGFFCQESSTIISKNLIVENMLDAEKKYPKYFEQYFEKTNIAFENNFTAINTFYAQNGTFIFIPKNEIIEEPIQILHLSKPKEKSVFNQIRNLVICEENSQVKIITTYHSLHIGHNFNNIATEIIAKENTSIELNIFQGEGNKTSQINYTKVVQYKNSIFNCNTITLCGKFIKNNIHIDFKDEHCETNLNGLYLADKKQHFDNHIFINHGKPNCFSNQNYKGIIDDNASAVFLGKVYVAKDAQQTESKQSNKNILLSESAKINSKPQLEIYADDVACSHGSSTGKLDEEALFYLRTRGLDEKESKILLLNAFAIDIVNKISITEFKNMINILVEKRMKGEKVEQQCKFKV